ncbi:MAG: hypothetical protein HDR80_02525 [Bacteroides sp.]|nr:hypothetical protein [Bacteroides sp.]
MDNKKKILITSAVLLGLLPAMAQVEDDIYYNPKKSGHTSSAAGKKNSSYIANFQDMDVDEYNMRGQYYATPVDTIGADVASAEDFRYTTQVQKFYNPTIVVDNADLLADVLNDSYGNVNIEFNVNGTPYFGPYYSTYNPWWNLVGALPGFAWNWAWASPSWSWGWAPAWSWGPGWSWSWGPTYAWGPSYYWGPNWGWGAGWGGRPLPPGRPYYADYRPGGHRPVVAGGNWAHTARPGGNYNGHRYTTSGRPIGGGTAARPGNGNAGLSHPGTPGGAVGSWGGASSGNGSHTAGTVSNGHRQQGEGAYHSTTGGHRVTGTTTTQSHGTTATSRPANGSATGSGATVNTNRGGHRTTGSGAYTGTSNRGSSSTSTQRRTSTSNNSNRSTGSYSSPSRNSSSGSYNRGGASSGGHRATGGGGFSGGSRGGGSRGGHR